MMETAVKGGFKRLGFSKTINPGLTGSKTIPHRKARLQVKYKILTKSNVMITMMAFLLGRAAPGFGMTAFAFPFYAVSAIFQANKPAAAAALLAGMLSAGAGDKIYVTAVSMTLFSLIQLLSGEKMKKSLPFAAVIVSVCAFIPQMVKVIMDGVLLYDMLNAFLSCFIAFTLVFVYGRGIKVFTDLGTRKTLSNEEIIGSTILIALTVSGITGLNILGISVREVLCIFLMLLFAQRFGPGAGAALGTAAGIITGFDSEYAPYIISVYAFCGLMTGILGKLGRLGAVIGFIMGNSILTLYFNGSTIVLVSIKEILAAAFIFLLIPEALKKKLLLLYDTGEAAESGGGGCRKIRELTVDRLNRFSSTFKELSRTFDEVAQTAMMPGKQELSVFMERITDKVCSGCSLSTYCWDRNFYSTYQVLFKIIETLDKKGSLQKRDIPGYFLDKCERMDEFTSQLNFLYEIYKVDMLWKGKLSESRRLISRQLDGLSAVIGRLADEIDIDVEFMGDLENLISAELRREGLNPIEVTAYKNSLGKLEVDVRHKGCKGRLDCKSVIEKTVSRAAGVPMHKVDSACCKGEKSCLLNFVQKEKFSVNTGIAVMPKKGNTVSGDCHSFLETQYGLYVAVISDGMGSGEQAAAMSRAAVSLTEQFMDAGFDKDATVQMINSLLFIKASDEKFTTLDLTVTDLHTGRAEFVKIGAPPTFLKNKGEVDIIKSLSMPAGVFSDLELEYQDKTLENGDFVIMVSDGVLDAFGDSGTEQHANILELVGSLQSLNAQQVADAILKEACSRCGENPKDDMTVLASKLWKRN